jgi:hypothetical protein
VVLVPCHVLNHTLVLHVDGLGLQALPAAAAAAVLASMHLALTVCVNRLLTQKQPVTALGAQHGYNMLLQLSLAP